MGYYWKPYQKIAGDLFEWLFSGREKREIIRHVPKRCRSCEILGICRDREHHWRCRHGCLLMK